MGAAIVAASFTIGDVQAQDKSAPAAGPASGKGEFVMGSLLPLTGPAALFGPGMAAAVTMAAKDINDAGGVLGQKVTVVAGDDAGDASLASQALDRMSSQGAKAIMGTGSTAITLALLDKTVRARVTMCAGATTGPQLSVYPHQGYFARTTFSNTLQAPVLGQLALEDGHSRIAVVGRGDAYGEGFAKVARDALKAAGADVVAYVIYDPQQTNFDAEVQQIAAANPDAIVMVGYEERGKIVRSMIERGIGPKKIGLYTTGLLAAKFWETVNPADASAIQGIKQTARRPTSPRAASPIA